MARLLAASVLTGLLTGCSSEPTTRTTEPAERQMFQAVAMRVHPIFTQVKDWTGDGKPDGIEVLLEFQDQFADPTKATGTVIFELYDYRRGYPDPRGDRVVNPWIGSLATVEQQREHWNRTSRTYSFQLAWPGIRQDRPYVLAAQFDRSGGGRFFDRIILEPSAAAAPQAPAPQRPSMTPKEEPGAAPAPAPIPVPSPTTRTPEP